MVKPSFLCIGGQRCGTTRLHRVLNEHPEIVMTQSGVDDFNKEVHYFDRYVLSQELDWYESHFPGYGVSGEITPAYSILNDLNVKSIKNYLPDAKIVYILRNPADRIWSQIRMMLSGWKNSEMVSIELTNLVRLFDSPAVQLRSDYLKTLNIWSNAFGAHKVLPLRFDNLLKSEGLAELLNFLQVSSNWSPSNVASAKTLSSPSLQMPQELRWLCAAQFLPMLEQLATIFPPSLPWLSDMLMDRDLTPLAFLDDVYEIRLTQELDCQKKWATSNHFRDSLALALVSRL